MKSGNESQKLFYELRQEITELHANIESKYLRYMLWLSSAFAGGLFVILLAMSIRYLFGAPPTP